MTRPDDYEDGELDYVILGITRSPGICRITGADREKDWDVKKAKGQTGATSTLNGDPVGTFEIEFTLSSEEDFERWDGFQALIESTVRGPRPIALPIYHPDLSRAGYTEVVCGGVGGRVYDGRGGATHKIKFLEYRPPKPKKPAKAAAKPGSSAAGAAGGAAVREDPNAAAKRELAGLLAEARRT